MNNYIHKYFFLLGEKRNKLFLLLSLFLLSSMLDLLGIGLIGPFISIATNPSSVSDSTFWDIFNKIFGERGFQESIIIIGSLIIASFIIKAIIAFIVKKYIIKFSLGVQSDITSKLMSAYQYMPYKYHLKRNTSSLILSTSTHTSTYAHHSLMQSLELLSEAFVAIIIFIFLSITNLYVMLSMVFLLGIVYLLYDLTIKDRVKVAGEKTANASEGIIKGVKQAIEGLREIRVYGKEAYFKKIVKDFTIEYRDVSSHFGGLKIIPRYLFETTIMVFVIILSIIAVFNEDSTSMFTMIGVFGFAAVRLIPSANRITQAIISMRFSYFAMNQLCEDLNQISFIKRETGILQANQVNNIPNKSKFSSLEIKNISYRYPDAAKDAISDLSMLISKNQSIGIIGKTGSGKTTLINILLGFFNPVKGSINFNGIPLEDNLKEWLETIAYIPQDVFIIDDSISNNIALGIPKSEIDKKKLEESINAAQLNDVIKRLPEKIDTVVGERGIRFSGGERQRLALARAFYNDREVIFMDEATAALDTETEQKLVKAINNFKSDKTMIMIAHRLSTLKDCDVIYKIKDGRIIEYGDYDEIINKKSKN